MIKSIKYVAQSFQLKAGDVGLSGTQVSNADTAWVGIMNTVYSIAGIVAVITIIIAGFFYVTSRGDQARIVRAKNAITYGLVGLVVVIMAFTITQLIIGTAQGGS